MTRSAALAATLVLTTASVLLSWSGSASADPEAFKGIITVSAEARASSAGATAVADSIEAKGEAPGMSPLSAVAAASSLVGDCAVRARAKTPNRFFRLGFDLDDSDSAFSSGE
jgi:hypothetical protein